jgi:molybdopterin synthase sulfur carrier subunit
MTIMQVTIRLASYLRPLAADQSAVTFSGDFTRVADVLAALYTQHPGVRLRVVDETGRLRQHVNIFVGQENVRDAAGFDTPVSDGAEISILPAVSGG